MHPETPDRRLDDLLPPRITAVTRYQPPVPKTKTGSPLVRSRKRSGTATTSAESDRCKRIQLTCEQDTGVDDTIEDDTSEADGSTEEDTSETDSDDEDIWDGMTILPPPRTLSQSSSTDSEVSDKAAGPEEVHEAEARGKPSLASLVNIKDDRLQQRKLDAILISAQAVKYKEFSEDFIPAALSVTKPDGDVGDVYLWNKLRHRSQKTYLGGNIFVFHAFELTYEFEQRLHSIGLKVEDRQVDQNLARHVRHVRIHTVDVRGLTRQKATLEINKLRAKNYRHTIWYGQRQFPNALIETLLYEKNKSKRWANIHEIRAVKRRLRSSNLKM